MIVVVAVGCGYLWCGYLSDRKFVFLIIQLRGTTPFSATITPSVVRTDRTALGRALECQACTLKEATRTVSLRGAQRQSLEKNYFLSTISMQPKQMMSSLWNRSPADVGWGPGVPHGRTRSQPLKSGGIGQGGRISVWGTSWPKGSCAPS